MDEPRPDDEWAGLPPDEHEQAPAAAPAAGASRRWERYRGPARVVAPAVAALLIGGGVVYAVDHKSGSSASASNGPGLVTGRGPQGGFAGGGGVAGEQRLAGTVTATTSGTVTVKTRGGSSATYVVDATTEIVRNGQAATLADVQVGDPVFVHVYPSSSGRMTVERLFAGTMPSGGGPGGFGPPGSGGATPPSGGGSGRTMPGGTHI